MAYLRVLVSAMWRALHEVRARPMKTCKEHGKNIYPTQIAAIAAAVRCSKKRGTPLRVYRHSCGGWHLTSKPRVDTNNSEQVAS